MEKHISNSAHRIFRATILTPQGSAIPWYPSDCWQLHTDGGLLVNGKGQIEAIGSYRRIAESDPRIPTIDLSSRILAPGFVDAHVHLTQYPAVGLYGKELFDWLETYIFPAERRFTPAVAESLCPDIF
jgi:guanine deaminase